MSIRNRVKSLPKLSTKQHLSYSVSNANNAKEVLRKTLERKLLLKYHMVPMDSETETPSRAELESSMPDASYGNNDSKYASPFKRASPYFITSINSKSKSKSQFARMKQRKYVSTPIESEFNNSKELIKTMSTFKIFSKDANNKSWAYIGNVPTKPKSSPHTNLSTEYINSSQQNKSFYHPRFYKKREDNILRMYLSRSSKNRVKLSSSKSAGFIRNKRNLLSQQLDTFMSSCQKLIVSHTKMKRYNSHINVSRSVDMAKGELEKSFNQSVVILKDRPKTDTEKAEAEACSRAGIIKRILRTSAKKKV